MQFYWKCEECDEVNPYPSVKVCGTCGALMTPVAEQRVLQEQKEEAKRQAQIKKDEARKHKEELRAKQEAEKKRQETLRATQQAEKERKRLAQLEQILKRREARETKFAAVLRKCTRISSVWLRSLAVLAVIVTVILFAHNEERVKFDNVLQGASENIHYEYLAHTVIELVDASQESSGNAEVTSYENEDNAEATSQEGIDNPADASQVQSVEQTEKRVSRIVNKVDDQFSVAFSGVSTNVKDQLAYLKDTYTPGDNISNLFNKIVEFLSGGVTDDDV